MKWLSGKDMSVDMIGKMLDGLTFEKIYQVYVGEIIMHMTLYNRRTLGDGI